MARTTDATYFPNGISQRTVPVVGGVAGTITCPVAEAGDLIVEVWEIVLNASGDVTAVTDRTEQFETYVTTGGSLDNTGGDNTAGSLLQVTLAKARDNRG